MTFAAQLIPHVTRLGAKRCAEICGVTARSIYLWKSGDKDPCKAMQAGVILLLSQTKR